jgi:dihydrofolate reductase
VAKKGKNGMKVILLDVMSLDGKLTKWEDSPASEWASAEDGEQFLKKVRQSSAVIMGSKTFFINDLHPHTERLSIIMTRTPESYKDLAVAGQLEFTKEQPKELIARLEKAGHNEVLLISGSTIATLFFQEQLIDELWMTIEPKLFGKGLSVVGDQKLDISLQLLQVMQLNKRGTLQLKYQVIK